MESLNFYEFENQVFDCNIETINSEIEEKDEGMKRIVKYYEEYLNSSFDYVSSLNIEKPTEEIFYKQIFISKDNEFSRLNVQVPLSQPSLTVSYCPNLEILSSDVATELLLKCPLNILIKNGPFEKEEKEIIKAQLREYKVLTLKVPVYQYNGRNQYLFLSLLY